MVVKMNVVLKGLDNKSLTGLCSEILKELKNRGVIRSKNFVGDLGEFLVIDYFNKNEKLPNLVLAPLSNKSFDAIDEQGKKYAIKTVTGNVTGVFYGLNSKQSLKEDVQIFDYAIVIKLDDYYSISRIFLLDWSQFLKSKKWHSRMKAWNLTVSKNLEMNCVVLV